MELNNNIPFRNALITTVEMKDGSLQQIVTLFNNAEICFEEISIGVKRALERVSTAHSMQSVVCSLKTGKAVPFIKDAEKTIIEHYNPFQTKTA